MFKQISWWCQSGNNNFAPLGSCTDFMLVFLILKMHNTLVFLILKLIQVANA